MKTEDRKINFNAGPATLPEEVLKQASSAILNYNNTGVSILEVQHRGTEFLSIIEECKQLVLELCQLDSRFEVLWLHGGGRQQFCMIPMNFLPATGTAGYIDSGQWSAEAAKYASFYGNVDIVASSKDTNYNRLPDLLQYFSPELAYLHITTNNTIYGTQWHTIPDTNIPLIADMSSDIFSCNRDYSKYHLFYAAAQKNLGIAGVGMVVLRKEMLAKKVRTLPPMLDFVEHVKENSILNTANVFGIYVSLLMLRWIKAKGINEIEIENGQKAKLLYDTIDDSSAFTAYITEKQHRSLMNICFFAKTPDVKNMFRTLCSENNIIGINGHRSVGGFRVSLYNAITLASVEKLVAIIKSLS